MWEMQVENACEKRERVRAGFAGAFPFLLMGEESLPPLQRLNAMMPRIMSGTAVGLPHPVRSLIWHVAVIFALLVTLVYIIIWFIVDSLACVLHTFLDIDNVLLSMAHLFNDCSLALLPHGLLFQLYSAEFYSRCQKVFLVDLVKSAEPFAAPSMVDNTGSMIDCLVVTIVCVWASATNQTS